MNASSSSSSGLALIVLAAGKGTRLGVEDGAPPKVMVPCLGAPLLEHVQRAVAPLGASPTLIVVGFGRAHVESWMREHWTDATPVLQEEQRGTGHAVRLAMEAIPDFEGDVLVVYGDVPQVQTADLAALVEAHRTAGAGASVLTGIAPVDAGALGRIVRDDKGRFRAIVEQRDAAGDDAILRIREFNSGLYMFDAKALRRAVTDLSSDNAQQEEYATDAVGRIANEGRDVALVQSTDASSLMGVNAFTDLADATAWMRRRVATEHLAAGVDIVDPQTTVIEVGVTIEPGARILPFTVIERGCYIAAGAKVGPFARLRGKAHLEAGAEVGNFVEVKASRFGAGAKAKHLTYIGDAVVGAKANIGCGTITANYDGKNKHKTTIGNGARIGSGTVLVAPVEIGEGAVTGANAVVLAKRDVGAGRTAVGVPARILPDASKASNAAGAASSGEKGAS